MNESASRWTELSPPELTFCKSALNSAVASPASMELVSRRSISWKSNLPKMIWTRCAHCAESSIPKAGVIPTRFFQARNAAAILRPESKLQHRRGHIPFDNCSYDNETNSMNVSLPEPLKKFVERKVAAGEFQSADEVVCEGLRLLQQRETWNAEARHKIDLGWDQAQSGQFSSSEEIVESLAARKEAW